MFANSVVQERSIHPATTILPFQSAYMSMDLAHISAQEDAPQKTLPALCGLVLGALSDSAGTTSAASDVVLAAPAAATGTASSPTAALSWLMADLQQAV